MTVLRDVFCILPSFRAEKSRTRRHLAEYRHIETEHAFMEFPELILFIENMIKHVVKRVKENNKDILDLWESNLPDLDKPFVTITYDDAVKLLRDNYNIEIPYGEDISDVLYGIGRRQGKEFGYYNGKQLNAYRYEDWKIKREFEGFPGAVWKKRIDPHPWLLINLKDDPGEQNNLTEIWPEKFTEMKLNMEEFIERMGSLPLSADFRGLPPDNSHYDYLLEKYGEEYYLE